MPKPFNFESQTLELVICGKPYKVDCGEDNAKRLMGYFSEGQKWMTDVQSGARTVDELVEFFELFTDSILGPGSFGAIFAKRKATPRDCADLALYLTEEIGAEYRRRNEKYRRYTKPPENREQRRNKARRK